MTRLSFLWACSVLAVVAILGVDAGRGLGSDLCAADLAASGTCTYLGPGILLALGLFGLVVSALLVPLGLVLLWPALGPMARPWSGLARRLLSLGLAFAGLWLVFRLNGLLAPQAGLCVAPAAPWTCCRIAGPAFLVAAALLLLAGALIPLSRRHRGAIEDGDETGA